MLPGEEIALFEGNAALDSGRESRFVSKVKKDVCSNRLRDDVVITLPKGMTSGASIHLVTSKGIT